MNVEEPSVPPRKPDDFLVWAVLCTVFCCLPLGIVSIVKCCQVDTYWSRGEYEGALRVASEARKWTYWGFGIAVGFYPLYLLVVAIGVVLALHAA